MFVSLSLFVFVTGVLFPVFVDDIVGLFVFVDVTVTSDVAAANAKWLENVKPISMHCNGCPTCNRGGRDIDPNLVLG